MLKQKLKKLGIARLKSTDVGKKIGQQVWFHKNYISSFMSESEYSSFKEKIPKDFSYTILRWNKSRNELAFIECKDFDYSHEPIVGSSYRVTLSDSGEFDLSNIQKQSSNPLIYHHKWLFVKDDYEKFDIEDSLSRSLSWKSILGVNRELSSKIGRLEFWDEWLIDNNLQPRVSVD